MQSPDFSKDIALVTGATGGIGKSICNALASLGCSVVVNYFSNDKKAEDLAEHIKSAYSTKAITVKADMRDYGQSSNAPTKQVRALHAEVLKQLGPPTILVNNAGSALRKYRLQSIEDVSLEEFETSWRINCGSQFLLTQLCMPTMREVGYGRVIFISTLHGLIHWLAANYAKDGITVNGVAPALIGNTEIAFPSNMQRRVPVQRLGKPEEIAETILWMVKTSYVTNKIVGVDGGMYPQ
ncbi:nodulation protein G [Lineolata rhizophorae]|uniref:Nodulation protein G n=1 Tax=Lineolata rhizophorae TaxID=578093 RepID=A0A6A6PDL0_9PEZI|nr:nodulation protein G [Lineolata rhizophorae]